MEICEQGVYRGMCWRSAPVRGEGSKTGQKETLNCDTVTTALPTGISGARMDLQHHLQGRQGNQASVPGSDQYGEGLTLWAATFCPERNVSSQPPVLEAAGKRVLCSECADWGHRASGWSIIASTPKT